MAPPSIDNISNFGGTITIDISSGYIHDFIFWQYLCHPTFRSSSTFPIFIASFLILSFLFFPPIIITTLFLLLLNLYSSHPYPSYNFGSKAILETLLSHLVSVCESECRAQLSEILSLIRSFIFSLVLSGSFFSFSLSPCHFHESIITQGRNDSLNNMINYLLRTLSFSNLAPGHANSIE